VTSYIAIKVRLDVAFDDRLLIEYVRKGQIVKRQMEDGCVKRKRAGGVFLQPFEFFGDACRL
jgi:hypothetical protein